MNNYLAGIFVFVLLWLTSCSSIPSGTQVGESDINEATGSDDTLEEVLKETGFIKDEQSAPVAQFDQEALEKALSRMLGDLKGQAEQIAGESDSLILDADGRYVIKRGDSLSEILEKSNLKILSALDLNDAARKIVEAIK